MGSYHCPADRITQYPAGAAGGSETWFDLEGDSYFYMLLPYAGLNVNDKTLLARHGRARTIDRVAVVQDCEAFHDKPGTNDAMNVLFLDMHVADLTQ